MLKKIPLQFIVSLFVVAILFSGLSERVVLAFPLLSSNEPSLANELNTRSPRMQTVQWEQEVMVKVDVQINSQSDLDRIQSLGYPCEELGKCTLELPKTAIKTLVRAGFEPNILEEAVVLRSSQDSIIQTAEDTVDDPSIYGSNFTNINIPDRTSPDYCSTAYSEIVINSAPTGAIVTQVAYSARIEHTWVTDLWLLLSNDEGTASDVWFGQVDGNPSTGTDGGDDDDIEDDRDLVFTDRLFPNAFDGEPVNQSWYLEGHDCIGGDVGFIDRFEIWIYYSAVPDIEVLPASLSFTHTYGEEATSAQMLLPQYSSNDIMSPASDLDTARLFGLLEVEDQIKVIVELQDPLPLNAPKALRTPMIASTQAEVLNKLSTQDFELVHRFTQTCGFAGRVTRSGLEQLLQDPLVKAVYEDIEMHMSLSQSVPLINADDVHAMGITGEGATVAVLDTGIDTDHPDLSDDLVAQKCFTQNACPPNNTNQSNNAEDGEGHGTSVSGIITSRGTVAPLGVAPDAKIVAVKVLDDSGNGYMSDWVAGIDWVVANKDLYGISIINMSLGGSLSTNYCDSAYPSAAAAVNAAVANGITVFAASGNEAETNKLSTPACLMNTISVGAVYDANLGGVSYPGLCTDATTAADKVTCFSNSNSLLDLLAPSNRNLTTGLSGGTDPNFGGTSAASPHAAAVAALMMSDDPSIDPTTIKTRLKETGVMITDQRNGLVFPRIDALAAVRAKGLSITNKAGGQLSVTDISVLGGSCWLQMDLPMTLPMTINGGQVVYIPINIVSCVGPGSYNDTIRITSSDSDEPTVDVPVSLQMEAAPGILVSPTSGLITSELGKTDQFTVTLMTHPTESVSINLSSSDLSEGTVNPSSITFLPENWNVPQTVTVTGVNDPDIDLDINYSITLNPASSSDPLYDLRDPQDVSVVNLDDDSLKIFLPMVIK